MTQRSFSSRKKSTNRYKPSKGRGTRSGNARISNRPSDSGAKRRAATQTTGGDSIFAPNPHEDEILAAQSIAEKQSGPPVIEESATPEKAKETSKKTTKKVVRKTRSAKKAPAEEEEDDADSNSKIQTAAAKVIKKVQRIIRTDRGEHDVVINVESLETRVAILQGGKLEEFNIERSDSLRMAGSIYKGVVKNLEEGLKAAFVDIGYEKNAFLHYWDIIPSSIDKEIEIIDRPGAKKARANRITHKDIPKLYGPGKEIVIQVSKGPIGSKGPRVTTNLSIPGRYLVLLPHSDQSGISRKIESQEERQRLKKILRKLTIPEGMGVVMRTAGEGKKLRYFVRDLAILLEEWKQIQHKIQNDKAPSCVHQEPGLVERTVRDFLTEEVDRIVIDDKEGYDRIQAMIAKISKRSTNKVRLYSETQDIFGRFNITRQLENAYAREVQLKSGGYVVFDETEALVAIDVNTGKHKSRKDQTTSTILDVNLEAAEEICRQLRLRNIGGLIVMDFIDMKQRKDQAEVFRRMKELLKKDRAKTHILPISQLGLLQMTRQRHAESIQSRIYETCQNCAGKGAVKSPTTMSVEIQRKLAEILKRRPRDESDFQLRVSVHPRILNRLQREDESRMIALEKKYFGKLTFRADPELRPEQFKITHIESNKDIYAN